MIIDGEPAANRVCNRLALLQAEAIRADPSLLAKATSLIESGGHRSAYAAVWLEIISRGVEAVVDVLSDSSRDRHHLKTDSPFSTFGLVDDAKRLQIIAEEYGRVEDG